MRFTSTPESIAQGKPSILAIVETVAAVLLSVWIGIEFGTINHIALSACLAPLLLLRTDYSTARGVAMLNRWSKFSIAQFTLPSQQHFGELLFSGGSILFVLLPLTATVATISLKLFASLGLYAMVLAIISTSILCAYFLFLIPTLVIRIASTVSSICLHPLASVTAIPSNSWRVSFCLDSCHFAESVPDYESIGTGEVFKVKSLFALVRHGGLADKTFAMSMLLMVFVSSLAYRWSLKSTSFYYLPLIWIAWTATRKFHSLSDELKWLYKGEKAQFVYGWSVLVILTFAFKFAAIIVLFELGDWWRTSDLRQSWIAWSSSSPIGQLSNRIIVPDHIPKWQIASLINAVMAVVLSGFAKRYIEYQWNFSDVALFRLLRLTGIFSVVLSCYTTFVMIWILWTTARAYRLPQVGPWFPWEN